MFTFRAHIIMNDENIIDFKKKIFFIFTACLKGNLRIATLLVEKGADVNLKDDEHHTPLHLSCQVNIIFTKKTIFFEVFHQALHLFLKTKQ